MIYLITLPLFKVFRNPNLQNCYSLLQDLVEVSDMKIPVIFSRMDVYSWIIMFIELGGNFVHLYTSFYSRV